MKLTKTQGEVKEYTLGINPVSYSEFQDKMWRWVISKAAGEETKIQFDDWAEYTIDWPDHNERTHGYHSIKFYSRKNITLKQIEHALKYDWRLFRFEERLVELERKLHKHAYPEYYGDKQAHHKHWWQR